MLDKWAFGMTRIEGDEGASKPSSAEKGTSPLKRGPSADLATDVSNVSLDTRAGFAGRGAASAQHGPSLLSATRPSNFLLDGDMVAASSMSIDVQSDDSSSSMETPVNEKITVKIADLGNGTFNPFSHMN